MLVEISSQEHRAEALAAVAEEGSFTRAADRLHVVQSAVSAGVRNLEKELGVMLFDRSAHSVKLTDAGRALLPEARALTGREDRHGTTEVGRRQRLPHGSRWL